MAVVGTAGRGIIIYTLEGTPKEYKRDTSPLKYQHRCISIFRDKKAQPTGKFGTTIYIRTIMYILPINDQRFFSEYLVIISLKFSQDLPWEVLRVALLFSM